MDLFMLIAEAYNLQCTQRFVHTTWSSDHSLMCISICTHFSCSKWLYIIVPPAKKKKWPGTRLKLSIMRYSDLCTNMLFFSIRITSWSCTLDTWNSWKLIQACTLSHLSYTRMSLLLIVTLHMQCPSPFQPKHTYWRDKEFVYCTSHSLCIIPGQNSPAVGC